MRFVLGIEKAPASPARTKRSPNIVGDFARQFRMALGLRGVLWATGAGVVGLVCCATVLLVIMASMSSPDIDRSARRAATLGEINLSHNAIIQTMLGMGTGATGVQEGQRALSRAWARLVNAVAARCGPEAGLWAADESEELCRQFEMHREAIGTELRSLAPPVRRMNPEIARELIKLGEHITDAYRQELMRSRDHVLALVDEYRLALLILSLSTGGFVSAGLVLIFLVGRSAVRVGEARDLLDETLEALPAGVVLYDSEDRLLLHNTEATSSSPVLKQPGSIGRRYAELVNGTAASENDGTNARGAGWVAEQLARFASKGDRGVRQLSDGRWIELYEKATPKGRTVGIRVDITDRMNHELELAASRAAYRLLFDANPYATTVTDQETLAILDANNAAIGLYGWSREEMLGLTADDFYLPEEVPAMRARRGQYQPGSSETVLGRRHRKKDGTIFHVEMAARIIDFQGRPAYLTIVTDIDERLRLEQAHRAAEEQLRQSQKMEAVGQLTGGIAHDFNNLLTVILVNAENLQEEEGLAADVRGRLDNIARAVGRAADLTRSLLMYSRKQALHPKITNINDVVIATGKLLNRALGEHIELDFRLAGNLWKSSLDRAQLEAALVNLSINARDAMPDGGRLLIETCNVESGADDLGPGPQALAGEYVRLTVTDTGTGMPPEIVAKVFDPFFTTKEVGKGSGLGLSMVHGFVGQSGGAIRIDSKVGRGTTFCLYFPRSLEDDPSRNEEEKSAPVPGGSERILVVEDEPQVRASVVAQLRSLGYAVSDASDGATAIAVLEAAPQSFDLLLTDVVMPGSMNGKALADEVKRRRPEMVVVFMSGYAGDALALGSRLNDNALMINKPFGKADIARLVRQALAAKHGTTVPVGAA